MGVSYKLVNITKSEQIYFSHISASSKREIAGSPVAAAIVSWYLLEHRGDAIAFVEDSEGDWPFPSGQPSDANHFPDVTDAVVERLIAAGILEDSGREVFDEQDPACYVRLLHNVWMD
jgi:hypothetical protein